MRYLVIRGERKTIPPYPHHKDYIYRCRKFFEAKNVLSLATINGLAKTLRKIWFQKKHGIAIPYNLLLDPTTACNIRCHGCWASDYERSSQLSFDKLDEILSDAHRLGISDILMSGGEPLLRKKDILALCRKHNKLPFALFTNGTLVDEAFAAEMAELGNLNVFISIEGYREATDFRRGNGTYDKVIAAMDILKRYDIGFGFSVCYHEKNWEEVSSDDFLDFMREKGAWMGWMFNFMPLGKDADLSLCTRADHRLLVKERVEAYAKKHRFTIIDFANSGHSAFGCAAAGNGFVHINANGDLEPCAFFHYSDANIRNMTLQQALASPFFRKYRKTNPSDGNPYRPCPIMDVPEKLLSLGEGTTVKSTHQAHPETLQELAEKTQAIAREWKPVGDRLLENMSKKEKRKIKLLRKLLLYQK